MASLGHLPDELLQTLADRGIRQQCPFCDNDKWLSTEPAFVRLDPDARGDFLTTGEGLPMIAFACTNCGFIRQHSTSILHRNALRR